MEEEKKIKLEVTQKQMETIFVSLLEIPAKYSLGLIQELQKQAQGQVDLEPKEDAKVTD